MSRVVLRKVQVALLVLMMVLLVTILLAIALDTGDGTEYGIRWKRPTNLTIDSIEADGDNSTFTFTFHLWDSGNRATEWDGRLDLELRDENNIQVLASSRRVLSEDFRTEKVRNVVDTRLVVHVPFEELQHVTSDMIAHPEATMGARATFTFGGRTLTDEVLWWRPPAAVQVYNVHVNEEDGWLELDVAMEDDAGRSTKWSGDLRLIVWDSRDFEMHNSSVYIIAQDFNTLTWAGRGIAWYRTWIHFEDIAPSADRVAGDGGNGSGGRLRVFAWFTDGEREVRQGPDDHSVLELSKPIPQVLLKENAPPRVSLDTDPVGLVGHEQRFDASGTTDDLGSEGLVYLWTWGDTALMETTQTPFACHTFTRAGSIVVQLTVYDLEGAHTSVNVSVEVFQKPFVDPDQVGKGGLVDHIFGSYPIVKMQEAWADDRQSWTGIRDAREA